MQHRISNRRHKPPKPRPTRRQPFPENTPQREAAAEAARTPTVTPDPRGVMSASLGDEGRIQLLRSHRYQQMQIRFDRQPDEKYLMKLKEAGWRDRTEEEGIWTRQVPKGEWKTVADARADSSGKSPTISATTRGWSPSAWDSPWRKTLALREMPIRRITAGRSLRGNHQSRDRRASVRQLTQQPL